MPIRILIAGYVFTLFAAILGCVIVARTRYANRGIWWAIGGLSSALTGMLLWAGIGYLPGFVTIVLANEAMLMAFVFLHQGIATVLNSPRRHIWLGAGLCIVQFLLFLYFVYAVPSIRARILVRTSTVSIQVIFSAILLLRHRENPLKYPARVAGGFFAFLAVLQISEFAANLIWPPTPNRLHPNSILAFYYVFNFMVGLGCWFAIVWLSICEQRLDLQIMATTDGLSGLLNRSSFDAALEHELRPRSRKRRPVALLLLDLDHFKAVNDAHGHQAGDEVIRRVSLLLRTNTRPEDAVARYGGEEFAVLLKGMAFAQAEVIAERLRAQIEQIGEIPQPVAVTASIGIALLRDNDTPESIFKRCDEALYLSKRLGRNRVSALEYAFHDI